MWPYFSDPLEGHIRKVCLSPFILLLMILNQIPFCLSRQQEFWVVPCFCHQSVDLNKPSDIDYNHLDSVKHDNSLTSSNTDNKYISPPLTRIPYLWDNLLIFYYLSVSEIWPDKKGDLCCEGWPLVGPYKMGGISWRKQFASILLSQCIWNLAW